MLLAVTNHLNRFVVVGIRRLAAALHRTLKLAHGTVIRVRARRDLHFGNCPVLSRIGERTESRINGHAQILACVGVLQRVCAFGNELKIKALLALANVAHDAAILHLAGLRGIRRILKSPGKPVVVLVDAHAVRVAGKLEDRLFGLPADSGFVGLAFYRMQTSLGADESRRAALVEVTLHRDPGPRSEFLTFVDAKKMASPRCLSMLSNIGMKVEFAQTKTNAQISESLCPFLALRHASCGLPLGRRTHFLNTIPSVAHDGVLKVAAKAETLPKPSAFFVSGNDRKGDDEGFRAHGRTLAQGCEMSVPCAGALSGMDECRIPPSE